jgi:plasmid stabilization system protein ParE
MRAVYLKRALRDLTWWRDYYENVFPEGKDNAYRQFEKTIGLLCGNPYLGHPTGRSRLREFSIPRMPFTLIYRIDGDVLRIARVVDQRSQSSPPGGKETRKVNDDAN